MIKKILKSDWTYIVLFAFLCLIAFVCYTPTTYAQTRMDKTTILVKNEPRLAKQDTIRTNYKIIIDNTVYPVYMNAKSHKMFIVRTSRKTGKSYRCYVIKGKKINELFK